MNKTQLMYNYGVLKNQYQGEDKRVVFVCSAGILRSATGARLYAHKYNTRCAGTEDYALIPLTENLLLWADEVVFVNWYNHQRATQVFDLDEYDCKVRCLNIEDDYDHMEDSLVQLFIEQYEPLTN